MNTLPHPTIIPSNMYEMNKDELIDRIIECEKLFKYYWMLIELRTNFIKSDKHNQEYKADFTRKMLYKIHPLNPTEWKLATEELDFLEKLANKYIGGKV